MDKIKSPVKAGWRGNITGAVENTDSAANHPRATCSTEANNTGVIMYSTFTNAVPEAMTLDKMLAAVAKVQAAIGTEPKPDFGPMAVRTNPLAMRPEPVKKHKHRHAQTEAYHKRIQKKWAKRYGTKQVPCAYMIDNTYLDGFGRTLVAHPSLLRGLRYNAGDKPPQVGLD